jgi:hypothetical protein
MGDRMAIQSTNRPLRPRDRDIDARMKVLGVLGFLLLAVALFSIGVFYIGPWWGSSRRDAKPPDAASAYTPPPERRSPAEEETRKGPDIKLEVTEDGVDAPSADEPAQNAPAQGGNDIRADENGLTITLDGKEKQSTDAAGESNVPNAVERSSSTSSPPKDSGGAKPGTGSSLEKPRAATEQHSTAAPGRE